MKLEPREARRPVLWLPLATILLVALLLPVRSWASAAPPPTDAQIVAQVDDYMRAAVEHELFRGSILVARAGRPIVSRSYGEANVELDVPNTPQTVFRLASVSKQFTAAAILLLQQRGQLKVGDRISQHLESCPEAWREVTIHHLLSMTSGMPGVTGLELGPLRGLPVPWDQWLEAIRKKPLDFAPGTDFAYANSGYTLLGFIIERVSGQSYGDFLREHIFRPAGMTRTDYEDPQRIVKQRATGYRQLPGESIANVPYAELIRLYAAGGVYSTTEDLLRWDEALRAEKILTRESIALMTTPVREMYPGKIYAYGCWIHHKRGRQEVAHGGNLAGFITYFARYPAEQIAIVVLSNNGRGSSGKISDVLASIVFGEPFERPKARQAITVDPAVLAAYVGEYRARQPKATYTMSLEGGRLMAQESGFAKAELFAESATEFFQRNADIQFRFLRNAAGAVTGFVSSQGDSTLYETVVAEKVTPPGP